MSYHWGNWKIAHTLISSIHMKCQKYDRWRITFYNAMGILLFPCLVRFSLLLFLDSHNWDGIRFDLSLSPLFSIVSFFLFPLSVAFKIVCKEGPLCREGWRLNVLSFRWIQKKCHIEGRWIVVRSVCQSLFPLPLHSLPWRLIPWARNNMEGEGKGKKMQLRSCTIGHNLQNSWRKGLGNEKKRLEWKGGMEWWGNLPPPPHWLCPDSKKRGWIKSCHGERKETTWGRSLWPYNK